MNTSTSAPDPTRASADGAAPPREHAAHAAAHAAAPTDAEAADMTPAVSDALRALRTPQAPATDLWPGIAARLAAPAAGGARIGAAGEQRAALPRARAQPRQRHAARRAWQLPLAMAASVAAALGVGWGLHLASGTSHVPASASAPKPASGGNGGVGASITGASSAMTREYEAAFATLDVRALPPAQAQTLAQLDAIAARMRAELADNPSSRLLLTQLRRVYARRLDLTQRFADMG